MSSSFAPLSDPDPAGPADGLVQSDDPARSEFLDGRGLPERAALIDLDALAHNVGALRRLCAPARLIAVVKADAYGHGAVAAARTVLAAGADMLGVAHVREGLELRAAGIDAPVLAWLHTRGTDFLSAVAQGIELGVSDWDLDAVAAAARRAGVVARVHLAVDSGLGRNGSTAERWPELVRRAVGYEEEGLIRVVGVFSHLAVADEPERPETQEQLRRFREAVAVAKEAGLEPETLHLANSPAALTGTDSPEKKELVLDAIRVGLALYGLSPLAGRTPEELGLRPVMTVQTFVSAVKEVPAGQGVSYGLNYVTDRPTTLALIPVGYADGVPRVADGGPVRICPRGAEARTYRVVGRVAMDQMVVDLGEPGLSDAALGYLHAPAVLFGAGENPSVQEWADAAGTINYEIVTRMSPRLDRVLLRRREDQAGATAGEVRP